MPEVTPSKYLVQAGWDDVPHLDEATKRELWESTPPHLRKARAKGIPIPGSGLVFPLDEELIKVPAFAIPSHWVRIVGIDFGWDHPFAAVWLAWDRDTDTIYVTDCYSEREATPVTHSAAIKMRGDWIPVAWPHDGLNHEKGSGEQLAKSYIEQSLKMLPERATFEDGGNSVEAGLFEILQMMQTGRFKVFSHLHTWFAEYRLYHRKDGKLVKLVDDLMSATRYAYMMRRFAKTKPRDTGRNMGRASVGDRQMGY